MADNQHSLWNACIIKTAIRDAFLKLSPRNQIRNPVMFTVYVGSLLTSALFFQAIIGHGEAPAKFILAIALWLLVHIIIC